MIDKLINGDMNNLSDKAKTILSIILWIVIISALGFLIITADNKKMKERTQRISTQEFMESLANGLQARWDIEEFSEAHDISVTYTESSRIEMKFIDKYCGVVFEDDELKDLFMHYYSALNMEYNAHEHTGSYDDYITAYNIGHEPAKKCLIYFSDYYDLRDYISTPYLEEYDKRLEQYRAEQ